MSTANRQELLQQFFETISGFFRLMSLNKDQLARQSGANRSQFELLMRLHHTGKVSIGQIAEQMHITSSAATQLAEGLVIEGWVAKEADPQDGRKVDIVITEAGQAQVAKGKQVFLQHLGQKLISLNDDDLVQLTHTMQRISQLLETDKHSPT